MHVDVALFRATSMFLSHGDHFFVGHDANLAILFLAVNHRSVECVLLIFLAASNDCGHDAAEQSSLSAAVNIRSDFKMIGGDII